MADDNQTPSDVPAGADDSKEAEASVSEMNDDSGQEAREPSTDGMPPDEPEQATAEAGEAEGTGPAADPTGSPKLALLKLIDLAVEYPKIGPPLAELAFKIGQTELGNRIVRMGLDQEGPGLEYYFVAAHTARREHRYSDARKLSLEAIRTFVRTPDDALASDDGERLMHLVRLGFSTMLFDEKDPKADPEFVEQLGVELVALEPRLGSEAFYHAILAQTYWYEDGDKSEAAWERAASLDTTESTWNARGTWYKDADKDPNKAEQAYRKGLEVAPTSPLLLHNLAQLLVDKAERPDVNLDQARRLLRESEQHLRAALREESPKGLRRHVHATRDRLMALRASFPPRGASEREQPPEPDKEPEVGEVLKGKVRSLTAFGAFIALPGRGTGLLHKSEIAHSPVDDPSQVLEVGQELEVKVLEVGRRDGKLRIALSRRALLPKPEGGSQPERATKPRHQDDKPKQERGGRKHEGRGGKHEGRGGKPRGSGKSRDDDKLASLGEMLLAKINQQKKGS